MDQKAKEREAMMIEERAMRAQRRSCRGRGAGGVNGKPDLLRRVPIKK